MALRRWLERDRASEKGVEDHSEAVAVEVAFSADVSLLPRLDIKLYRNMRWVAKGFARIVSLLCGRDDAFDCHSR